MHILVRRKKVPTYLCSRRPVRRQSAIWGKHEAGENSSVGSGCLTKSCCFLSISDSTYLGAQTELIGPGIDLYYAFRASNEATETFGYDFRAGCLFLYYEYMFFSQPPSSDNLCVRCRNIKAYVFFVSFRTLELPLHSTISFG